MHFDKQTQIVLPQPVASPVRHALRAWDNDCRAVLGAPMPRAERAGDNTITLTINPQLASEQFTITPDDRSRQLQIEAGDDLGLVFALYHLSQFVLGVDPYAFWTDQHIAPQPVVPVPVAPYRAPAPKAQFRGWFINDEDLLIGWHDDMSISMETWHLIFETMLRGGYNMVIAGSGMPAGEPQFNLAAEMGLWITHHHCEPLGSRMYRDFYPDEPLRIPEDLDKFDAIYLEAIRANRGRRMVWGLGFRGQGDEAFFKHCPEFDTVEKRGAIISRMIRRQRELIEAHHDGPCYFCHNIYAESAELYQAGVLDLDPDVIRVFGDNGFGAMRARPCSYYTVEGDILARPRPDDLAASQGVYYHFSFLGGGAASKLTPLVDPELVVDEINQAIAWGKLQFVIVNVSAVKPQLFHTELLDRLLRPRPGAAADLLGEHYRQWTTRHVPSAASAVEALYRDYFKTPFQHGTHRDDRAGEQLYHNTLRCIVQGVLIGDESQAISPKHHTLRSPVPPYQRPTSVSECLELLQVQATASLPDWAGLATRAEAIYQELPGPQAQFFADTIRMYIRYSQASVEGFVAALAAVRSYRDGQWKAAYLEASTALRWYRLAVARLVETEHDKWQNFYRGDWKTGSRETVRVVGVLQGMAMLHGKASLPGDKGWTNQAVGSGHAFGMLCTVSADWDALARVLEQRQTGAIQGRNVAFLLDPDNKQ